VKTSRTTEPSIDLGEPACIISINEAGDKFELNERNIDRVFNRANKINSKKVVVVSVVGAFRTGKSLLLDVFLRYLQWSEKSGLQVPEEVPVLSSTPEWLMAGGTHLHEGNAQANPGDRKAGFTWRGGKDRTTTGIWMWDKPFKRRLPSGETVPVILMDTQGMFDFNTSSELTAAIFGLSTLISSYQIYNLKQQIQEDKLQQLHYFTEFSQVALRQFHFGGAAPEGDKENDLKKDSTGLATQYPFQSLEFLIRDWQNFDDDKDMTQCLASMPAVLEEALQQSKHDEGMREQIKMAFQSLSCFLLSHPGLQMTNPKYDGDLKELDPTFITLLDHYTRRVFFREVGDEKTLLARAVASGFGSLH